MGFRRLLILLTAGAIAQSVPGFSQTFSSGSNGSDGPLNFNTPGTIDFDPAALGLNPAGDNIFNFTSINIAAGVTVNMRASKLRERSVVWLAMGAVTIAGTLNLSGANGYLPGSAAARAPSEPGPGGYPGGVGGTDSSPAQNGSGPGGGTACGSYATANCGGTIYGNSLLVPLRGGSGGAGVGANVPNAAGGGAGGGAIQIVSSVSITVTGSILANGGAGGNSTTVEGFGGSGGAIHLEAPIVAGTGVVQATGVGVTFEGTPLLAGDSGWLRVDAPTNSFTGTFNPAPTFGPLFNVPLPSAVPTVSIKTISGVAVPSAPTGSFTTPDITINNGAAVPVVIAAANIPLGTMVNLVVSSETGADQTVSASPLTGSVASSTATANIVWPLGVSRVYIRAVW